jgi:large subunit ribosomal protein L25
MDLTLTAETGRTPGSRTSSRLRTDGHVPAVVYGLGRDTVSVTVPWTELRRVLSTDAGINALISLDVDGQKDLAIVKDLQRHPIRRNVMHIDFLRVDPDAPVAVDIPIHLVGEAKAVEGRRGIVDHALKTITVKAKPADIPSVITVDINDLKIGVTITIAEVELPAGVFTEMDPGAPVVTGAATRFSVEYDHEEGNEPESATASADESADESGDADSGDAAAEAAADEAAGE